MSESQIIAGIILSIGIYIGLGVGTAVSLRSYNDEKRSNKFTDNEIYGVSILWPLFWAIMIICAIAYMLVCVPVWFIKFFKRLGKDDPPKP